MNYAVYVDIEGYLNSWDASRLGRNTFQLEVREEVIKRGNFPFALINFYVYRGLSVSGGGKDFALACWNGRVALDQPSHHSPDGLDPQREGRYVQQQHVLDI